MSETRSMEEIREALDRVWLRRDTTDKDGILLCAALDELEELRAKLSESKTTCAYCLATHDAPCPPEAIREHIEVCPKHPLALVRSSLVTASKERDEARRERDEIGAFHADLERIGRDEDATRAELARVSKEKDMFFERLREYARDLASVSQERDRLREALVEIKATRCIETGYDADCGPCSVESPMDPCVGCWAAGVARAALAPSPTGEAAGPTRIDLGGGVSIPVFVDPNMRPDQPPYFVPYAAPSPTEGPRGALDVERLRTAASDVLGLCNLLRGKGVYSDEVERKFCALSDAAGLTVGKGNYRPAEPTEGPRARPRAEAAQEFRELWEEMSQRLAKLERTREQLWPAEPTPPPEKKPLSALLGKWPGDETDEQIAKALRAAPPEKTPTPERCGDPVSAFVDCNLPYGHKGGHVHHYPGANPPEKTPEREVVHFGNKVKGRCAAWSSTGVTTSDRASVTCAQCLLAVPDEGVPDAWDWMKDSAEVARWARSVARKFDMAHVEGNSEPWMESLSGECPEEAITRILSTPSETAPKETT